MLLTSIN